MSRFTALTMMLAATAALAACGDNADGLDVDPAGALSTAEQAGLIFTREEEKLARDVYAALDDNGQPFVNIQASEQRHMDAILVLLDTYGLPDPAATTAPGQFVDPTLQGLYASLVSQGQASAAAALTVGCTIEDLDLRDLDVARADATHADLDATYDELARGSRNHLRAFYGRVVALGGSYTPQYIDQAAFDAIVASPQEQGGP